MAAKKKIEKEPSQTDDQALYLTIQEWVTYDIPKLREWRARAKENFAFIPPWGQWTAEDKALMEGQNRVPAAFNKTSKYVRQASGLEVNNRQQTSYIPTEPGNEGEVKANELLTVGSDWMDETSDAPRHQSRAFRDMFITGVGGTESLVNYDEDPEGLYEEPRINPLELGWDADASEQNVMDSKRRWRVRCMTAKEAKELLMSVTEDYASFTDADLDASWAASVMTMNKEEGRTVEQKELREDNVADNDPKRTVHIVQIQWFEFEPYMWTANPTQDGPRHMALSVEDYKEANRQWRAMGAPADLPAARLRRKVFKQAFVGGKVLWTGPAPRPDGFTINIMTGEPDEIGNSWYGIVDLLKDPQRFYNKLLSQFLHMVNSTAKGGILIESDAVEDVREFLENYPRADAVSVLRPGSIGKGKVMAKPGVAMTAGVLTLMQIADQAFSEVTGMNVELMGMADRDQPGVLEAQRKQAAMTIMATLFDSLSMFRKDVGRTKLYFMQNFLISDQRWIMIDSKDGPLAKKLTTQDTQGKYNTRVGAAPTAPDTKERAWASLQPILPFFVEQGKLSPELASEIIDFIPGLPSKLAEAMKRAVSEPDPGAAEQAQLAKAGAVAQVKKDEGAAAQSQSSAVLNMAKAVTEQAKAQQTMWEATFAKFGMAPPRALPPPDDQIIGPSQNQLPQPRQMTEFGADEAAPMAPPQPTSDVVLPGGLTQGGF